MTLKFWFIFWHSSAKTSIHHNSNYFQTELENQFNRAIQTIFKLKIENKNDEFWRNVLLQQNWNFRNRVDIFCFINSSYISKNDEFHDRKKICFSIFKMCLLILKNICNDELIREKKQKNHLFFELDLFLNELNEKINTSKSQTEFIHSKKTEHQYFKFQTATKSKIQVDQQTRIKIVSIIIILISTRIVIHIFSTKWNFSSSSFNILKEFFERAITSNWITMTQRTKKFSISNSRWFVIFNHRILSSQHKNDFNWIFITFYITLLSVNSISYVTVWNFFRTTLFHECECVDNVNFASTFSKKIRYENAKKYNTTTWIINKFDKIMNFFVTTATDNFHKWKNFNTTTWTINKFDRIMSFIVTIATDNFYKWKNFISRSISTIYRLEIVVSSTSKSFFVTNVSNTHQILLMKNQTNSMRTKKYEFETKNFFLLSIAFCTIFNR